jgi:rhamnose utilization protein RhaD (predicted bifunctional aldolase and dehydrogenase)
MQDVSDPSLENLWDDADLRTTQAVDQLVYASNLLGSDARITNYAGGNTSLKIQTTDPLSGKAVSVLYVKGSGSDLARVKRSNFATLNLDQVLELEDLYKEQELEEDEVADLLAYTNFNLNTTPRSIDTFAHAFIPFPAVAHLHSDPVLAIADSEDAERLTGEVWEGDMAFMPYQRPGFAQGQAIRAAIDRHERIRGVLLEKHGFFCWAEDWRECYELAINLINRAQSFITNQAGSSHPLGELVHELSAEERRERWKELLPRIRGAMANHGKGKVVQVDDSPLVLDFVSRSKMADLAGRGTACPDHYRRTKPLALVLDPSAEVESQVVEYQDRYRAYYERHAAEDTPKMRNPNPNVVLVPGLGMATFGRSSRVAEISGLAWRNTMRVIKGAESISVYRTLSEEDRFNEEYWRLEDDKLKRLPAEKSHSRKVAVVGALPLNVARPLVETLVEAGAAVMMGVSEELGPEDLVGQRSSDESFGSVLVRKTDDQVASLADLIDAATLSYGGVDMVIGGPEYLEQSEAFRALLEKQTTEGQFVVVYPYVAAGDVISNACDFCRTNYICYLQEGFDVSSDTGQGVAEAARWLTQEPSGAAPDRSIVNLV